MNRKRNISLADRRRTIRISLNVRRSLGESPCIHSALQAFCVFLEVRARWASLKLKQVNMKENATRYWPHDIDYSILDEEDQGMDLLWSFEIRHRQYWSLIDLPNDGQSTKENIEVNDKRDDTNQWGLSVHIIIMKECGKGEKDRLAAHLELHRRSHARILKYPWCDRKHDMTSWLKRWDMKSTK